MLSEMQRENMQNLLENLRSGEYTQGQGRLRPADDEYCCMGVAVATLGYEFNRRGHDGKWQYNSEGGYSEIFLMPDKDAEKFGLNKEITKKERDELPESTDASTRQDHLVWCNDKVDYSFLEIADEIERMGWDK